MSASRKQISKRRNAYVMKGCNRKGCNVKNCYKRATKKRATRRRSYKLRGGCAGACVLGGMKGGNSLPPVPYTPATSLPGAASVGAGNLKLNTYSAGDIQTNTTTSPSLYLTGGYTYGKKDSNRNRNSSNLRRSSNLKQKGGWRIIPQDVTNFGRGITSTVVGAYNAVQGYPQPVSYLPYEGQFPKRY